MTFPGAASESPARAVGKSSPPKPRTAGKSQPTPDKTDLWRAYELAQQHYEMDLQLFSTRMNLFLLIQSGLVALAGGTAQIGNINHVAGRSAVASFGLALAVAWLLVASSSYLWVKSWRAHMIELGGLLQDKAGVEVSSKLFNHERRRKSHRNAYSSQQRFWEQFEFFSWFVRPTLVTCCLPLLFVIGWIYIGWLL
jgi:hypothetical protein